MGELCGAYCECSVENCISIMKCFMEFVLFCGIDFVASLVFVAFLLYIYSLYIYGFIIYIFYTMKVMQSCHWLTNYVEHRCFTVWTHIPSDGYDR